MVGQMLFRLQHQNAAQGGQFSRRGKTRNAATDDEKIICHVAQIT